MKRAALTLLGVWLAMAPAAQGDTPPDFAALIRQLAAQQDRAAGGHREAVKAQRDLLSRVARDFGPGAAAVDATPRNAMAMLVYVLSGGSPSIGETFASRAGLPPLDTVLLKGAAAFMRGDKSGAAALLEQVEFDGLTPPVAGRVALVKAMLLPDADARKLPLLHRAIAALPGSLVEEAALRRLVFAATSKNQKAMQSAFERYLRRFGASLYAQEFIASYLSMIVAQHDEAGSAGFDAFQLTLHHLPQARRRTVYFMLARQALHARKPALVQFAAKRARRLSPEASPEHQRADLHDYAFAIAGENGASASAGLRRLDPRLLPAGERALLKAALAVADAIVEPAVPPSSDAFGLSDVESPVRQRATAILAASDAILQRIRAP